MGKDDKNILDYIEILFGLWIAAILIMVIVSVPINFIAKYRNNKYSKAYLESANVYVLEKEYNKALSNIKTSAICSKGRDNYEIIANYRDVLKMYSNENYTEAKELLNKMKEMEGFDYEKYKINNLEEDINSKL